MRITAKTVPAGNRFMTRFPQLPGPISELFEDDKFSEPRFRSALRDWQDAGFVMWGDDSRGVCALVAEFLHQLSSVTAAVEEDMTTDAHTAADSAADRRLVARAERGRFAFTRFDFASVKEGLRVRISVGNPLDIPGTAIESARRFAVYAARVLQHIQREVHASKMCKVILEGVGEASDVFAEAEWTDRRMVEKDAVEAANAKRMTCACRLGEYCSPSDPSCRCYRDGKCVDARLPKEFERWEGSRG